MVFSDADLTAEQERFKRCFESSSIVPDETSDNIKAYLTTLETKITNPEDRRKILNVNIDQSGNKALHILVREKDTKLTRALLEAGADVNAINTNYDTPLHVAAQVGSQEFAQILVEGGANLKAINDRSFSIEKLKDAGYTPDTPNAKGDKVGLNPIEESIRSTPKVLPLFSGFAFKGNKEVTDYLILAAAVAAEKEAAAKEAAKEEAEKESAAKEAGILDKAKQDIKDLFIKDKVAEDSIVKKIEDVKKSLEYIAEDKGIGVIKEVFNQGLFGNDSSPLRVAAERGHTKVVSALLEAGASHEIKNKEGNTALHLAAEKGHTTVVSTLLKAGASHAIKNSEGKTALHVAAERGHTKVVSALLEAGASHAIGNGEGKTALEIAKENKHSEVVSALLGAEAEDYKKVSTEGEVESQVNSGKGLWQRARRMFARKGKKVDDTGAIKSEDGSRVEDIYSSIGKELSFGGENPLVGKPSVVSSHVGAEEVSSHDKTTPLTTTTTTSDAEEEEKIRNKIAELWSKSGENNNKFAEALQATFTPKTGTEKSEEEEDKIHIQTMKQAVAAISAMRKCQEHQSDAPLKAEEFKLLKDTTEFKEQMAALNSNDPDEKTKANIFEKKDIEGNVEHVSKGATEKVIESKDNEGKYKFDIKITSKAIKEPPPYVCTISVPTTDGGAERLHFNRSGKLIGHVMVGTDGKELAAPTAGKSQLNQEWLAEQKRENSEVGKALVDATQRNSMIVSSSQKTDSPPLTPNGRNRAASFDRDF